MKYARVVNNTAVDARTESPEGCFTPDFVAQFVEISDDVMDGWLLDSGIWSAPPYIEPPPFIEPEPVVMPYDYYIDIGPFFDRFGAQQIPVLANPDVVNQAIIKTTMARKWIDLRRSDLVGMLALIKSKNPGVTDALISSILATPVSADENMALRKAYFY